VVHVVQRLPVASAEEIVTPRHEREEVLGPTRRFLVDGHQLAFLLVGSLLMATAVLVATAGTTPGGVSPSPL
jgi:hypothetical protein